MLRRGAFILLVSAVSAMAQRPPVDSASRWVDSILAPLASRQSPGCAVGVRENGGLVLAKGFGMADLEHDTQITPETPFYIASLSKQFTAMAVVLLARDHRLSLDDSIRKWVPEVPSFGAPITLRELLHHTSGLRDYFTLLAVSGWPTDGHLTEHDFLALVGRQKSLNFAPGDEFLYSNTGYALLSIVVKRASGQSLRDFAAERIFKPLGMMHTEYRDDHTSLIRERALGYQPEGQRYRLSQPQFDVVGDGGVYSTIDDLAKWDANFETGRVGGKEGIELMQTPGRLNDGQEIQYALGLNVGDFRGHTTYSHSGAYGGDVDRFAEATQRDVADPERAIDGDHIVQRVERPSNAGRTGQPRVPGRRRPEGERRTNRSAGEPDGVRRRPGPGRFDRSAQAERPARAARGHLLQRRAGHGGLAHAS